MPAAAVESATCCQDVPKWTNSLFPVKRRIAHSCCQQALLKYASGGRSADRSGDDEIRLAELERLLLDVRAGRISDFTMPGATGRIRLFVTLD
ncbi:hypothetical protein J2W46_005904 [Paraburkholderia strydomiana]|nr:hypothetical protein [Paraburkholderia strydomiana]